MAWFAGRFAFCGDFIWRFAHLPSPNHWPLNQAYAQLTHPLSRLALGAFFGVILARFINVYILAKAKVLLSGRFFWLRSMFASSIGIVIHTAITVSVVYYGVVSNQRFFSVLTVNFLTDLLSAFCLSWVSVLMVMLVKNKMKVKCFDHEVNFSFNPFSPSSPSIKRQSRDLF